MPMAASGPGLPWPPLARCAPVLALSGTAGSSSLHEPGFGGLSLASRPTARIRVLRLGSCSREMAGTFSAEIGLPREIGAGREPERERARGAIRMRGGAAEHRQTMQAGARGGSGGPGGGSSLGARSREGGPLLGVTACTLDHRTAGGVWARAAHRGSASNAHPPLRCTAHGRSVPVCTR